MKFLKLIAILLIAVIIYSGFRLSDGHDRVPAQIALQTDPPIFDYLNPRLDSTDDWGKCARANECHSSLCLQGTCIPRYFSNQKASPGQFCVSKDQCFSDVCDTSAQKCVGSTSNVCAYVGQFCNDGSQCCSGTCDSNNLCEGDPVKECGTVGAPCSSPDGCCSQVCDMGTVAIKGHGTCGGSSLDPGTYGQHCISGDECISNVCNTSLHICN